MAYQPYVHSPGLAQQQTKRPYAAPRVLGPGRTAVPGRAYVPYEPGMGPGPGGTGTPPNTDQSQTPSAQTYSNTIPGAGMYLESERRALDAWQKAQATVHANQSSIARKYGLQAQFDTNGNLTGTSIDPSSQYGLTQQMLHGQADNLDQLRDNEMSRGLHGPGLGNQDLSNYRWQMGKESFDLGNQFVGDMAGQAQQLRSAGSDYQNSLWTAEQSAAQDALKSGNFNPADVNSIKDYLKKLFGSNYQGVLGS